ncbi:MAG: glycoside hydrolase family 97 protein [Candidatus Pseudobacter hemicellulosilyticus]|uniref:Glycoside hydrolase family 97 protein n=1 Tax=Candidatus Pseudobacter hemicellulosilyticus TaxID=3121375 RepID=A0AAJ6BHQ7_9BACT|nr:MAG: glycoside hydrolase family 97 protein [Pseudobacter sp.]
MNKVQLDFRLDEKGIPTYAVQFGQQPVILPARMGFTLNGPDSNFSSGFVLTGVEQDSTDESWEPVWGEVKTIRNHYKELLVHLQQQGAPQRKLAIRFRVFEEGVGFRYEIPRQPGLRYFVLAAEHTEFPLSGDHQAFWIPGDYDSNEYQYTHSPLSAIDNRTVVEAATDIAVRVAPDPQAVQTPLMLKTATGLYINIHEAALVDYPAMQLHVDRSRFLLQARLVPDAVGNKAYLQAPARTPWRTIIVSDKATELLSSKMILNLNPPSRITETSWIRPMKFLGVWWEMQTAKSGWNYSSYPDSLDSRGQLIPNRRHGANTANVKKYIDFAAANGIGGVLVEGWNTGWEDWFGNWTEHVFSFVTPYPDLDVAELTRYAAAKNVQLIMHHETSGAVTDYERQLDTAFRFMNQFGYQSVKTGYVGRIIPRGEHHDGQWMVNHYIRVAEKAAQHRIMIDVHEPARPTGQHRTWPNWMASEAGRGNEYNAFSIGSPPDHETILPFTRLMGGPMDYTPGIFSMKGYTAHAPQRGMHSTLAKQLALYVTLYSPLQMAADYPENYAAKPDAFQFIREVPVDWDDTRILAAEPGDYLTIARKEKGTDKWFVGSITDEVSRPQAVSLSFLDKGKKYLATIYADGPGAHWETNPEAYAIQQWLVDAGTTLQLSLAPGGGAAVSLRPATEAEQKSSKKYKP